MRCGTGGTVERPLPTESTFAAATRIFKHAVAAKYFEDGILDTWICVSTALAAEAWGFTTVHVQRDYNAQKILFGGFPMLRNFLRVKTSQG